MKVVILTILGCLFLSSIAYAERPMNEIPMYGGQYNPEVAENKESSQGAADLGWKYLYRGDFDTAIKRFNQAWMFDRKSVEAFWGFGIILGQRAKNENVEENLKQSVFYLEKANSLSNDNPKIMVDLAYSETLMGNFLKENKMENFQQHYDAARGLFEKAEQLEKGYPLIYSNWSILEFFEERYLQAKEKMDIAKSLGFQFDPGYEKELTEKLK